MNDDQQQELDWNITVLQEIHFIGYSMDPTNNKVIGTLWHHLKSHFYYYLYYYHYYYYSIIRRLYSRSWWMVCDVYIWIWHLFWAPFLY